MAGTVTTDLSKFTGTTYDSLCDLYNSGDWTLTQVTPALDADYQIEGAGCLSAKLAKSGATTMTAVFISSAAGVDLSNKNVYMALLCLTPALLDSKANGGMRVRIEDASGNWGEWYVDGNDTYLGGWQWYCCNVHTAYNNKSATAPSLTTIKKVGWTVKQTGGATKTNFFWDAIRYGTGLSIKGGTAEAPTSLQDFYDYDNTNKLGVVIKYMGVYLLQGKLNIGDAAGVDSSYFKDTSGSVAIFRKNPAYVAAGGVLFDNAATPVPLAGTHELKLQGNATETTEVYFGAKSGSNGINGAVFKAEDASYRYKITATDTNVTKFGFFGCTFQDAGVVAGQAYNVNKEFLASSFVRSERMVPNTGLVTSCVFSSAPGAALLLAATNHNAVGCSFINCGVGIETSATGSFSVSGYTFSGNVYDVLNTSAGAVTVNAEDTTGLATALTVLTTGQKAQSYNNTGAAYVDESTPAFDAAAYDINVLADASPEAEDAYLFGCTSSAFLSLLLRQEIAAVATWTITWEYSTGAGTWATLSGVSDDTVGFTATAPACRKITYTNPGGGWVTATYNSITAYWIRARISAYTSRATAPKGSQAWLGTTSNTTLNNTVTVKVTVKDAATTNVIQDARVYLKAAAGGPLSEGTVILNALSDVDGVVQNTAFDYTADQPVTGWVRKGTASPLYQTAPISGTIDANGYNTIAFMVADE